jgi:hypothetical protein
LILLLPLGSLCPSGAASARRTPLSSASAGLKTQPAAELPAAERDEPAAEQLQVAARPIRAPPWRVELAGVERKFSRVWTGCSRRLPRRRC